jgi:hypothetical protein
MVTGEGGNDRNELVQVEKVGQEKGKSDGVVPARSSR